MQLDDASGFLQSSKTRWAVTGLIVLLFTISNLPWQLDDYDQAKQAFVSFEMVREGHWLYQRTPNEKVATKPPLAGWVSAGLFAVTRSWEAAWRLPSFLAALVLLALLYRTAAKTYGQVAGLIAMSAFGLNLLALRLATLVRTDIPLALVIFLLGWQIWNKVRERQQWTTRDRLVTFALLTAAMLIKGPIVYAFLLPGLVFYQWRAWKNPTMASAWSGWWPWLVSFGVFLIWVFGGILFVPGFFQEVVMKEFVGRFGETVHRPQAIYFYLPHLLHKFAPWSILGLILVGLWMKSERVRVRDLWRHCSPETFWLICWSLGGLIFMSLIPSKRVDRIFPVIPPTCLILAAIIGRGMATEGSRRMLKWCAVALGFAVFFSAGYAAVKIGTGYWQNRGALVSFGKAVRQEARHHNWRFEVIGRREEGLLLYLERTNFADPDEVIAKWKKHEIDAVVVPEADRPLMLRDLEGAVPSPIQSWKGNERGVPRYVLLTRS